MSRAWLRRFWDALNRPDVGAIMALMGDECVSESATPGQDRVLHVGQEAGRKVWEQLFTANQQ
jgi:hypothetical protein